MSPQLLLTTDRGDLNAVRYQGLLVTESYAQIYSTLKKEFGQEHALFFAEPSHSASSGKTDWYSEAQGAATPLPELPESEQASARQRIGQLAGDIKKLAAGLQASSVPAQQIRGNMLLLALRYPQESCIYVVGDQPVLTCWGFEPGPGDTPPEDLVRMGGVVTPRATQAPPLPREAAAAPLPPTPPAIAAAGFPWLRVLFALLLGLLLCLALLLLYAVLFGAGSGCALFQQAPTSTPGAIQPELAQNLSTEQEEAATLLAQLEALRRQLTEKAALCVRQPETPLPLTEAPAAPPPPPADLDALLQPEEPLAQKHDTPLVIPDDAREKNDFSFLEGCWTTGDLRSTLGNEKITVTYCFNKDGTGTKTIYETKSKNTCKGSLQSRFDASGKLVISESEAKCSRDSTSYSGYNTECTQGKSGRAECYGVNKNRRSNKWSAEFRRQ